MDALNYLNDLGINTANKARAVRSVTELNIDAAGARQIVTELTGQEPTGDDDHVMFTLKYLVQDVVEGQKTDSIDKASVQASEFLKNNPWVLVKPETTSTYTPKSTVDALGKPKQKKGAKKAAAIKFWNENQNKYSTRKEWITALSENVGLTPAAASTYYHNLKTGQYK